MKILMIGNSPKVHGGISAVIRQIREYDWKSEGIRMVFIPTFRGGCNTQKLLYFVWAYCRIVWTMVVFKPDIVYMHMSHHGSFDRKNAVHRLCRMFRIPDIIHLHGSEFVRWYGECSAKKAEKIRKLLRECGCMIVLGQEYNRQIHEIEQASRTVILNNAVIVPQIHTEWKECLQVLFLGVLIKRKGVSDLLDAIRLLKERGKLKSVHFVIAGSGPEEEALKKQAEDTSITDAVSFVGWIEGEKKMRLLAKSHILVLPSYNEGLPVAILEAMSYGMPVVASAVGDVPEAVIHGYNGYLIKPGDTGELANDLEKMMDREHFLKLSENARQLVIDKFSDKQYFHTLTLSLIHI